MRLMLIPLKGSVDWFGFVATHRGKLPFCVMMYLFVMRMDFSEFSYPRLKVKLVRYRMEGDD